MTDTPGASVQGPPQGHPVEEVLRCHACKAVIERWANTRLPRGHWFRITMAADGKDFTPREHRGTLLLCLPCWNAIQEPLRALVDILDGPEEDPGD